MSVETKLMTAEELWALPNNGTHRYELVRGELITMSPSSATHSNVAGRIAAFLGSYILEQRLGQPYTADGGFLMTTNPDTVFAPDFGFVRAERVVQIDKFFPGPPDLAVEVISPSDTFNEVDEKVREYLAAGTRMVIVINPRNQSATVYTPTSTTRLTIDDTLSGGDVVPGLALPLRELFS